MEVKLKLENIRLHNKLIASKKKEQEFKDNSKKLMQTYLNSLKKYEEEIQKLKKEKLELEEKYNTIPRIIKKILKI